ncbi:hypothetical protein [Halomarina litorea]|uniref:hypothetical protein n=1 Tax=Halomarina litorea TaxID=2961595 RepID=UPI0020C4FE3B|nr:hypothetical protein [Halomarina sp. BCD28]
MNREREPVDVEADLTLTIDSQPINIESYTDTVLVDLPSVRVGVALVRTEGARLAELDRVLRDLDVTVVIQVDGTPVARLGADARPQFADLAPVEVVTSGALRAAIAAPMRFFS